MANQTVTTVVNYDSDSVLGLDDGNTITINGGTVTIDADNRWGQNNAVFGAITISTTIGGNLLIDGTKIWELPFTDGNGIVPELSSLDTNTLSGNNSLATGEFFRVWASGGLEPLSAGTPMPSAGYVKIRSRTGDFQAGETVVLPGSAATFTTTTSGKRSWINVVGRGNQAALAAAALTLPRLGTFRVEGDWYELGTTNGQDDQEIQLPFKDVLGAIQIETSPGSNQYEWWSNGAQKWFRNASTGYGSVGNTNLTLTYGVDKDPFNNIEAIRYTETAVNGIHRVLNSLALVKAEVDTYTFVTYLKKNTRRYGAVQITVDTTKLYTIIVDLDNGDVVLTDAYNSPQNPSHVVTDVGDGWYKVEISADHTNSTLNANWAIGTSNSATPTLGATTRLPSYTGSTAESMLVYGEEMYASNTEFIADNDERGKFFGMTSNGLITLAKRTNGSCGYKPASGCKIRIPNTILSNAAWTSTYPENSQINTIPKYSNTRTTRYQISTTAAGALYITKAALNWANTYTGAFEANFYDCSILDGVSLTNTADRNRIINCGISSWSTFANTPIVINTNFTGTRIENTRASRINYTSTHRCTQLFQSNDTTIRNCRFDIVDGAGSNSLRPVTPNVFYSVGCDKLVFEDNICIGGIINTDQTTNSIYKNTQYAAYLNGNTRPYTASDNIFYFVNSSSNILVDGLTTFSNLTGVYPYGGSSGASSGFLAYISTYSNNITMQNVGTPNSPIDTGVDASDPNATYTLVNVAGTTFNLNFKKMCITACRANPIRTVNTTQTVLFENVWVKDSSTTTGHAILSNNTLVKGGFYKNINYAGQASVYGTHWQDFFKTDTEGQILIACNEPLESTVDQCSATFGEGGGFTSAGSVSMITPGVGRVEWTTPYYILGHTSLGYGLSSVNPPFAIGVSNTTIQNHEFLYQIDNGSGFSDWKFLFGMRRRSGGGAAGTTTVTVDNVTTNRAPSAGDYIWTSGTTTGPTLTRVTPGTKITDYDPNTRVITVDTPFNTSVGSNEQIIYWNGLEDEVVDPNTGFKLKVKLRPTEQNDANAIVCISIPTRTDAVSQQIQYQEPAPIREGSITNIIPNSRLQIYNSTTSTEVYNNIVPLSSFTFTYEEGGDFSSGDIARVRLTYVNGLSAKVLFETRAAATEDGWSVLADQIDDPVYSAIGLSGGAITEFATDYPNIEIDINDPDGETSIHRLYSWWVANEYTEDGIRNWAGGLVAEDAANFKVVTSKLDLKLDNLSLSGVQFTGDLRLYRDDGQSPLVNTTTGGGSITLYAGKVYNIVTAQSGLTPSESAQIGSLSAIKINTDLIPGIV